MARGRITYHFTFIDMAEDRQVQGETKGADIQLSRAKVPPPLSGVFLHSPKGPRN